MQLYDMHSHILPKFDDGASSIEESVILLDSLNKQGVTNVCLTSHFYTNEMSAEDFISKRNTAFLMLKPYIPDNMNVVVGAEVYVTKFLKSNDNISDLTYGNSKYILTEFPYNSTFSDRTMNYFYYLIDECGLIPIIPHVERYSALVDEPSAIKQLRDIGILFQTNIVNYSKTAPYFKKKKLIKLIKSGFIDMLGTDAHSMKHGSPELYTQAVEYISEKSGYYTLKRMMDISKEIFDSAK